MGAFSEGLQRYLSRDDLSLKTSGAETASTTGTAYEVGDASVVAVTVDVTAVTGTTPTMLVDVETSDDNLTWFQAGEIGANGYRLGGVGTAPSNITTTGKYRAVIPVARFVRYKSTIGGTSPSFTYSVGGSST